MRKSAKFRFLITFLMLFSLLSPTSALAFGDGKKHFKQGMKHEDAKEWDKAVEEFALAIADNPKNAEYRLHYRRALFNASQMFMEKGRFFVEQKDYESAYTAFRKAYGYDPVNELARQEMERMLRLQKALIDGDATPEDSTDDGKYVKTSTNKDGIPDDVVIPQRYEVLRNVVHPNPFPLKTLLRELAESLDLNVLFDSQARELENAKITIELKNVTPAQALDAIFLQENLYFEKVGPRTILITSAARRSFFQQLVIKTFYLGNADPKDVSALIQKAIPAQPGRTPTIVLTDEDTNSITIRDTAENIRLMGKLIQSLDKDRAEVVMDVQIFEVTKGDLLRLGSQIGTANELSNLGGVTRAIAGLGGNNNLDKFELPLATGVGIAVPSLTISALQNKSNTKVLASTQIHSFNNEDSSARIGQRVPVRTASFQTGAVGGTNTNNGVVSDVINYEQVGLTLKFKPIVFPNQDVQVTMDIESKNIGAGPDPFTPIFTDRSIKGTARIQNNKTLLLASVAQNTESKSRSGIPLLGLIPVLGRLFTTPENRNDQVDIVIAITPRVIRSPAILPEDLEERESGTLSTPTGSSLQAMLIREEVERQQNLAKNEKRNVNVQLPDAPTYVKSTGEETSSTTQPNENKVDENKTETIAEVENSTKNENIETNIKPIATTDVRTLDIGKTVKTSADDEAVAVKKTSLNEETKENAPLATLQMMPKFSEMKTGQKTKVAVMIKSAKAFRSAVLGLRFDENKVAIREVSYGEVFGSDLAHTLSKPFINQGGKMYVSLQSSKDVSENSSGILAYIEIEALTDGTPEITFESDMLNLLTADGNSFIISF